MFQLNILLLWQKMNKNLKNIEYEKSYSFIDGMYDDRF